MVEYNTINVGLSDSQLNKLKTAAVSANNLPHELLLTTRWKHFSFRTD